MTETLAPKLNATVLFAEHRYYGKSFPFGDEKTAFENKNLKYLNVEQVFKDYIEVIKSLKSNNSYDNFNGTGMITPVYAFGGSYGGMLAAWIRMKYPTHI